MRQLLKGVLAAVALSSAVGCASSPDSRVHTLVAQPGGPQEGVRLRIQVRRPSLPRELDTDYIVRHATPTQLEWTSTERWGAPLEVVVGQTLVENLALRLPDSLVYSEEGPISAKPDVLVETEFQQFGSVGQERATLEAHVAFRSLNSRRFQVKRYAYGTRVKGGNVAGEVEALSRLLGQLSSAVALTLVDFSAPRLDGTGCTGGSRGDLPR